MVAPRKFKKVFCTIVRVSETDDSTMDIHNRIASRPSELLPWADPYIARLVTNLQQEVRSERDLFRQTRANAATSLRAELEPPTPITDAEWDWQDDSRWTLRD